MVLSKDIVNRNIIATGEVFNIDKVYKSVKEKADDLNYKFFEQEQSTKPGKYGQEMRFKFLFVKEVDFFDKNEIEIEFEWDSLNKVKGGDKGNCKVTIKGKMTLDYKNRWGMSKFNKFLLGVYAKIKQEEFKKKYMVPLIKDCTEIQEFLKDKFGFYTS